jgi:hypothetical protein
MNRSVPFAALTAALLLVAGCSAPVPVENPSTPSSSPSSSSVGEPQEPETGEAAPAPVFDGECAQVLTDEQLATIFDVDAETDPYRLTSRPDNFLVQQLGGLRCLWSGGEDDEPFIFYLDGAALAASALGSRAVSPQSCELLDGFEVRCEIVAEANGLLLSTILGLPESTDLSEADDLAAQVATAFESNAAASAAYRAPVQSPDAWPLDFSCDDLDLDVSAIFGRSGFELVDDLFETHETPVERVLWGDRQALGCSWVVREGSNDFMVQIVALGGAAWAADDSGALYPVDGVDAVYTSESGSTRLFDAVGGPNWVQVSTSGVSAEKTGSFVAAAVAALNAL